MRLIDFVRNPCPDRIMSSFTDICAKKTNNLMRCKVGKFKTHTGQKTDSKLSVMSYSYSYYQFSQVRKCSRHSLQ